MEACGNFLEKQLRATATVGPDGRDWDIYIALEILARPRRRRLRQIVADGERRP